MKNLIFTLVMIFLACGVHSQTSFSGSQEQGYGKKNIKGRVIDAQTNEPIIGANVVIKGTTVGSVSDINGEFEINYENKKDLTLTVSYVSYKPYEQIITFSKEKNINVEIKLEENVKQIDAVTVVGNKVTNSEVSMMQTIRSNNLVVNGVAAQLIKKTQDKDAGEVVKRIPGITIQGERFVIIRGLNERYNSVWLNNLPAPSAEADVKAFSFDFIPASMIDNILVYKTFSPELPGDFAGGLVQIFTNSSVEKNFLQVSYSNGFAEGSSFKEHKLYDVGGKGFYNGMSELTTPSDFPENIAEIPNTTEGKIEKTKWGQSLNKLWNPTSVNAPTNQQISISGAWKKDLKKIILSNYSQLNYGVSFLRHDIFRAAYNSYDEIGQVLDTNYAFNDVQYNNSNKLGAMMNWAASFKKNKIEFRNIFNYQASNKVVEREGKDFYGGLTLKGLEMAVKARNLYSGQLSGNHIFGEKKSTLNWFLGYSASSQQMPDNKRLTWVKNDQEESPYYNKYGLNFSFTANADLSGRIFHSLFENQINAGTDYSSHIKINDYKINYSVGVFHENKERTFSARNLGYKIARTSLFNYDLPYYPIDSVFSDENINYTNGIMLDEQTSPSDTYTSFSRLYAGFFTLTLPIGSRIKIHTGLRAENNYVELNSYKIDASFPAEDKDKIKYINDTTLLLPAINITYSLTETSLLRFAYGKTVNRPEYREIAPMAFYDYEMKAVVSGNDKLTFATINNFDLRYELYPNVFSMFSVGAFYKQFYNPIEYCIIPTGSGLQYSYQNTPKATVGGLEVETRLALGSEEKNPMLKNFTLFLNAAVMKSVIEFEDNSLEENRPLQGQSPYIVNASLFYKNDKYDLNVGVMYNVFGKRINFVGDPYTGNPHIFEMPANNLDFSVTKGLGKNFEIKGQVKNILDNSLVFQQELKTNNGKVFQTNLKYKQGRYYSIGLVWKI